MQPVNDYYLAQIKYLQWQEPRNKRPWLLKTPCHFGYERHLCRIFDKPRFVVTHRDPAKCIPSISTTSMASRVLYSDDDSSANLGASVTALFSNCSNEHIKWRDETPGLAILDIGYDELNSDAMSAARKIYDYFGMPLTAKSEAAMRRWEDNNRRDKHPPNQYSAAAIGMTEHDIRNAFKGYVERFPTFVT